MGARPDMAMWYARLDIEDKAALHIAQGYPFPPELLTLLLRRLDRRDGCHLREVAVTDAAHAMLRVLNETTRPVQPAVDDAAARLAQVLAKNTHHREER